MTLQELRTEADQATHAAIALHDRVRQQAEREHRELNASEMATVKAAMDRATDARKRVGEAQSNENFHREVDRATGGMASSVYGAPMHSLGQQFLDSEAGRWLRENKNRGSNYWSTPVVELMPPGAGGIMATTIVSDPGTGNGGLYVPPEYLPGITGIPLRPPKVADLLSNAPTTSNAIVSMRETAYTDAAAAVAEGGAKPESAISFAPVTDPVVKIAHWIPITDELLEDVPAMAGYLNARLIAGLRVPEDDQLLNGSGVAPNMLGLLKRPGLAPPVALAGTDTNADAIAKQLAAIEASTYLVPTGVIMHPTNWQTVLLTKDTMGRYIGGSPFATPQVPTLWGKPVAITKAIALGTALIVTQSAAMVFHRGGISVQASNSHQDFFVKNLQAVRCEERLALAVFLPAAFGPVTGLN